MFVWKPIKINKIVNTFDDEDNSIKSFELYHACKAEINCLGGKEYYAAKQVNSENEVTFTVRFCAKLRNLTPQGYCIEFDGDMYDIAYIDNYMMSNEFLKIKAVVRSG